MSARDAARLLGLSISACTSSRKETQKNDKGLNAHGSTWAQRPVPVAAAVASSSRAVSGRSLKNARRTRLRTAEGVLAPTLFADAADEFGDEFFTEGEGLSGIRFPDNVAESRARPEP